MGKELEKEWSEVKWSEVTQSSPTLCDTMYCSPPGSLVHGISQAWILEWVAISFSRGSSLFRDRTQVSCIVSRCFTVWATREGPSLVITAAAAKSLHLCPTLCNPTDGSPPGPAVPGILQARTLEWVAISFSRRSSQPRDWTQVSLIVGRCFTVWATREA